MRCGCIILWTRVFFNSIVWQCCQTWLSCHVSGSLAKFSGEHVELRLVSSIFSVTLTSSTLWAILWRWYDEPTVTSSDSSSDSGATCSSQGAEFHFESATGISSSIPYPASPATPSIPSTAIHSTSTSDHISCSRTTNSDDSDIQPTCFQCTLQPRRHAETDEGHSRIHHESCRGEEPGKTQIFHRCQLIHQLPAILLHQLSSHLQCQLHIVVPDHTTTDLSDRPDKRPMSIPRSPRRTRSIRRTHRSSKPRSISRRRRSTSRPRSRATSITLRSASPRHRDRPDRRYEEQDVYHSIYPTTNLQPAKWDNYEPQSTSIPATYPQSTYYDKHHATKWKSWGQWKDHQKSYGTERPSGWIDYTPSPLHDNPPHDDSTRPIYHCIFIQLPSLPAPFPSTITSLRLHPIPYLHHCPSRTCCHRSSCRIHQELGPRCEVCLGPPG